MEGDSFNGQSTITQGESKSVTMHTNLGWTVTVSDVAGVYHYNISRIRLGYQKMIILLKSLEAVAHDKKLCALFLFEYQPRGKLDATCFRCTGSV